MDYNKLYSSFDDDTEELYLALSSVISDDQVIREAVKNYQLGRAQDLRYAETVMSNGGSFRMVDRVIKSNIRRRTSARPGFDLKLRRALQKKNALPDLTQKYDAHHIVAKGATRAKRAAEILFALGIDIDDPDNGVFLPKDEASKKNGVLKKAYIHGKIHTRPYYANVNFQVVEAFENGATTDEMKSLLREIADELQRGTYPIHQYIPGAEDFA